VLSFLDGTVRPDLHVGRADGSADGVNPLPAALECCGEHQDLLPLPCDAADVACAGDLLEVHGVEDRRWSVGADAGDDVFHGKAHSLIHEHVIPGAGSRALVDIEPIDPLRVHLPDFGGGPLEDFDLAAQ